MKKMLSSRRHRYLAKVSIFLIMVALITGMTGCNGNQSTVIEIQDWYGLDAIRNNLNGDYILVNDLDSSTAGYEELASPTANGGKGWEPIGNFTGRFDGQGYEIKDLFIDRPEENEIGLFGWVGEGGNAKNVGVVEATVTGNWAVGGLVGTNYNATVSNCYATSSVSGNGSVGGLVGRNAGTVSDCYSTGSVNGVIWVGGLVGYNFEGGTVSDSYSTGNVTGECDVGGLVARNHGTVSDCYSTGSVNGDDYVGGLLGTNAGIVSNSYSNGSVTGEWDVGGLVGFNYYDGTVSNSHYNYDALLINGENMISVGALFGEDFDQWLDNDKFLDVNGRLAQEDGYYVINNVSDFKELLAFGQDSSLKFRLKDDLDLANEPDFYIPYLAGEFDGNGHKISNLSFSYDFISQVGLFGYLVSGGAVTGVNAENVNITGYNYVGGLVGTNYGTVSNSYSTGSVTGNTSVGGLVGWNTGNASNSYSIGSATGDDNVGGLVGTNYNATVSNSYSTGSVSGTWGVGGLVGRNWVGNVSNSFWDTETSGQNVSAGGTGKNTTEMKDITTFSGATWNITTVGGIGERNITYIWNIVNNVTYPFLSWQP